jgi:spore coat protein U-like protein
MLKNSIIAVAAVVALGTTSALAANSSVTTNATGQIKVQAQVSSSCNAADVPVNFGSKTSSSILGATVDTNIIVVCDPGTEFAVALPLNGNASGSQRRMKAQSSADYLAYDLCVDTGCVTKFDTAIVNGATVLGQAGSATPGGSGTANIPLHAEVPAAQAKPIPANYFDDVTISIGY